MHVAPCDPAADAVCRRHDCRASWTAGYNLPVSRHRHWCDTRASSLRRFPRRNVAAGTSRRSNANIGNHRASLAAAQLPSSWRWRHSRHRPLPAPSSATTTPAICWRAPGFGPTDAEVRAYATLTREAAVAKLLRETRTTALTPPPDRVARHAPASATRIRRPPPPRRTRSVRAGAGARRARAARLVGAGDAGDAVAAHRADDALLAQPFRVGPAEGARRAAHVPAERHAARQRHRQFRRAAACDGEGPGDARLSRRRAAARARRTRTSRAR